MNRLQLKLLLRSRYYCCLQRLCFHCRLQQIVSTKTVQTTYNICVYACCTKAQKMTTREKPLLKSVYALNLLVILPSNKINSLLNKFVFISSTVNFSSPVCAFQPNTRGATSSQRASSAKVKKDPLTAVSVVHKMDFW